MGKKKNYTKYTVQIDRDTRIEYGCNKTNGVYIDVFEQIALDNWVHCKTYTLKRTGNRDEEWVSAVDMANILAHNGASLEHWSAVLKTNPWF